MLNYRPNGRRRLGKPLKRLLDEAETGLLRPHSSQMMMMIIVIIIIIIICRSDICFERKV